MKVLILTQYFPPEVGAPQNRLFELGQRICEEGVEVHAFTAMPNYPKMEIHNEYKGKLFCEEKIGNIKVFRSYIYVSKNTSIIARLLNYFSFVFSSLIFGLFKLKNYDVLICESPPLFLGISAKILAFKTKAKLVFNVSDLWPESAEKLGLVTNKFILKLATILEEWLYKTSDLITGQTQGIVENISSRFPLKKVYWLPNGVDLSFYNPDLVKSTWREDNDFSNGDILLLYAGIIGHAQGLEVILKAANLLKNYPSLKFLLLGSGPEKNNLIKLANDLALSNVFFFDGVGKDKMPQIIKSIDIALVLLKKLPLFEGAIPSKIFENLAMKKPILLGVEGEAFDLFIKEGQAGLSFEPENFIDLKDKCVQIANNPKILNLYAENARSYVSKKFNREIIAKNFYQYLLQLTK